MDYKTLISEVDKYSDEADRIFNKLHRADLEAKTGIIEYGKHAYMERIEWDYSDENEISDLLLENTESIYSAEGFYVDGEFIGSTDSKDKWKGINQCQ